MNRRRKDGVYEVSRVRIMVTDEIERVRTTDTCQNRTSGSGPSLSVPVVEMKLVGIARGYAMSLCVAHVPCSVVVGVKLSHGWAHESVNIARASASFESFC